MGIIDIMHIIDSDEKAYQDDKIYYTLNDTLCDTIRNLSIILHLKGLNNAFKDSIVNRSILLVNVLNKAICIKDEEMAKNQLKLNGGADEKKND